MKVAPTFAVSRGVLGAALGSTLVGAGAIAAGFVLDRHQLLFSYLVAFVTVSTLVIGALGWLLIFHSMNTTWPVIVRRVVEAIVGALPAVAILSVPVFFGLRDLYTWATPERVEDAHLRELLHHKHAWLNPTAFIGRSVFYLLLFVVVGELLLRWSFASDKSTSVDYRERMRLVSCAVLPPVGIAFTFAAFDWLMSLTPAWYSTMFGVCILGGGLLSSMALIIIAVYRLDLAGALPGLNRAHYYALGRCLLCFVIFWAYVEFFQFMLIWIANKPEEVTWFVPRVLGAYRDESLVLTFVEFVVPFLVLLPYATKQRGDRLTIISVVILVGHFLDAHWMVAPAWRPDHVAAHWLDAGALLFVGGATALFGLLRLRGRVLVPVGDTELAASLRYDSA